MNFLIPTNAQTHSLEGVEATSHTDLFVRIRNVLYSQDFSQEYFEEIVSVVTARRNPLTTVSNLSLLRQSLNTRRALAKASFLAVILVLASFVHAATLDRTNPGQLRFVVLTDPSWDQF